MIFRNVFFLLYFCFLCLYGCYYDKEENLYPNEYIVYCDTVQISFSGEINSIIQNNCTGCHSGSSPAAGIVLVNYTEIRNIAMNGALEGVVEGKSGYPLMPPSGRLPECERNKIKAWIKAGSPNN